MERINEPHPFRDSHDHRNCKELPFNRLSRHCASALHGRYGRRIVDNESSWLKSPQRTRCQPRTPGSGRKELCRLKEIEFEAVRDAKGNKITICSMENFDPGRRAYGDSIVVAPAQTLTDIEYQTLRTSALKIVEELRLSAAATSSLPSIRRTRPMRYRS
jgi:SRSO17 transposase